MFPWTATLGPAVALDVQLKAHCEQDRSGHDDFHAFIHVGPTRLDMLQLQPVSRGDCRVSGRKHAF